MKKLQRFEPACSGIVVHLGLNRIYPQLAHHNFFYSRHQDRHFDRVFREKKLPDDPTIYLVAPTRTDPSQAPPGCDNIKILPHIPYINEEHPYTREDYVALKELCLTKLERMGLTDLRKHIVVEDFWTPFDIQERYALEPWHHLWRGLRSPQELRLQGAQAQQRLQKRLLCRRQC